MVEGGATCVPDVCLCAQGPLKLVPQASMPRRVFVPLREVIGPAHDEPEADKRRLVLQLLEDGQKKLRFRIHVLGFQGLDRTTI